MRNVVSTLMFFNKRLRVYGVCVVYSLRTPVFKGLRIGKIYRIKIFLRNFLKNSNLST